MSNVNFVGRHTQMMGDRDLVVDVQGNNSSKLVLIFCDQEDCDGVDCYCCQSLPDIPCYRTWEKCQDNCPKCDPKC